MNSSQLQSKTSSLNPLQRRRAGVLCHITSLSTQWGIGDLGPAAYQMVDLLHGAHQSYWQILPVGNTDNTGCPYATDSAFGGAPFLISPELLMKEGLLKSEDLHSSVFKNSPINYEQVTQHKINLLKKAFLNFIPNDDYQSFLEEEKFWIKDYARFQTLKKNYGYDWRLWPQSKMNFKDEDLREEVHFQIFVQYKIFSQFKKLKNYANSKNIQIIGDLPIFVSFFSLDVWSVPQRFLINDKFEMEFETGAAPDAFSAEGQKWGTPYYDWSFHKSENYQWWKERFSFLKRYFDIIRIDHFRGFEATWLSSTKESTAKSGFWNQGPGREIFFKTLNEMPPIIAEDLGVITPEVEQLRDEFNFPGMRIVEFISEDAQTNPHHPSNYSANTVLYTGTHDCETLVGWIQSHPHEYQSVLKPLLISNPISSNPVEHIIESLFASKSNTVLLPIQDLLQLDNSARLNTPGTVSSLNWTWKISENEILKINWQWLKDITLKNSRGGHD